ncbi:GGDEF domain-containing protein [Dechloromonas sp.]|uniref:GGDEF domain-containing protein n=1 Tax=Dechloromonas sp. TaxID=1917218 RepID=UPI001221C8F7|nr:GGDEF domain-containing protein [Dechloromonas sp.]MBU3695976.1 GGDEF domain-containing protein [Dechloromonas sp.]TEX47103.1 MAG: GGDEF domain-containing protein [Rhodocyclaceae bacterium]
MAIWLKSSQLYPAKSSLQRTNARIDQSCRQDFGPPGPDGINSALVDTLLDLFSPQRLTVDRCYVGKKKTVVFACAGFGPDGQYLRNAFLPEHRDCQPIDHDPLLKRCQKELSAVLDVLPDGTHRIVFPVIRLEEPQYMVDVELTDQFSADHRVTPMGLIEYFGNHIALLDYGEADTVAGLASRKTFEKHLFELLDQAASDERTGGHAENPARRKLNDNSSHWLAVCDIDHFKQVNDTFGHLIGDEVLIMIAQVMHKSFRFDDQLFRFGGEEFIALLQPTDPASAQATLDRFRRDIEETVFSRVGHVTVCVGVSFSRLLPNDTPTDVIDRADEALYYAKHNGRNRVDCYESLIESGGLKAKEIVKGEVELF